MPEYSKIPLASVRTLKSTDFYELIRTVPEINRVSVQIWWEEFNAFDGTVTAYVKKNENAPFVQVPLLKFFIDNEDGLGGGSCIFTHNEYSGYSFAIKIDKGSATLGKISTITEVNERSVGSSYSYSYGDRMIIYPSIISNTITNKDNSMTKSMNTGALTAGSTKEVNTLSLTGGVIYPNVSLQLSNGDNNYGAGILRLKTPGNSSVVEVNVGEDIPEGLTLTINFFNN